MENSLIKMYISLTILSQYKNSLEMWKFCGSCLSKIISENNWNNLVIELLIDVFSDNVLFCFLPRFVWNTRIESKSWEVTNDQAEESQADTNHPLFKRKRNNICKFASKLNYEELDYDSCNDNSHKDDICEKTLENVETWY